MRTSSLFVLGPLAAALPSAVTPSEPRDLTEAERLEKRNTNEGVYLTNCKVCSSRLVANYEAYGTKMETNVCALVFMQQLELGNGLL